MLIEVQPEAEKPEALVGAGRQQHQKLLHDALERDGSKGTLVEKRTTPALAPPGSWACSSFCQEPAAEPPAGVRDLGLDPGAGSASATAAGVQFMITVSNANN